MATIHIQKNELTDTQLEIKIQSVPFKIHADCDSKLKKYFHPYIKQEEESLTASFRGYPLKGTDLLLPESYKGIVLHESVQPVTEKQERKFYIQHFFNELRYWNWDKTPSKNDLIVQAMEWIDIAEAGHHNVL